MATQSALETAPAFVLPNQKGQRQSLQDYLQRGPVLLAFHRGTWCPNCHDEAQFLQPFCREHRDQGFEVIALMFERHGDFAMAAQAVAAPPTQASGRTNETARIVAGLSIS